MVDKDKFIPLNFSVLTCHILNYPLKCALVEQQVSSAITTNMLLLYPAHDVPSDEPASSFVASLAKRSFYFNMLFILELAGTVSTVE